MRSGSRCPAFCGEIPLMKLGFLDDDGGYFYCITYIRGFFGIKHLMEVDVPVLVELHQFDTLRFRFLPSRIEEDVVRVIRIVVGNLIERPDHLVDRLRPVFDVFLERLRITVDVGLPKLAQPVEDKQCQPCSDSFSGRQGCRPVPSVSVSCDASSLSSFTHIFVTGYTKYTTVCVLNQ